MIPYYSDLLGQEALVEQLSSLISNGRVPHALLLSGGDGGEAYSLALAFARHILCLDPADGVPCGVCSSCKQVDKLEHPDFNLVFPIIKEGTRESTSADYMEDFRDMVLSEVRFTEEEWRAKQDAKNKQLQILVSEAEQIIHATSLRSFRSRHQVFLVWLPELMRSETANKLLKVLEEPPEGVVFLMVSHDPDRLLPTIISRLQQIIVPGIPQEVLVKYLVEKEGAQPKQATEAAHLAQGNLYHALRVLAGDEMEGDSLFGQALEFLTLPLSRDPKLFRAKADELSKMNRPDVIAILENVPKVLRETLAMRYSEPAGGAPSESTNVVYVPKKYQNQALQVSQALSPDRYTVIVDDIADARQELRQNANIKIVFFDLFLNLAMHYAKS